MITSEEVQALAELIGRPISPAERLWAQPVLNRLLNLARLYEQPEPAQEQEPAPQPSAPTAETTPEVPVVGEGETK